MSTTLTSRAENLDQANVPELVARYNDGSRLLEASVKGLRDSQLRARPVEGQWSILETVCHIGDCEQLFAGRMKQTLALERPLLLGVDTSAFVAPLHYDRRSLTEELALIELTRDQMTRIFQSAPTDAWSRPAIHSEAGLLTLRQLLATAINHLEHHLQSIQQKRQAMAC